MSMHPASGLRRLRFVSEPNISVESTSVSLLRFFGQFLIISYLSARPSLSLSEKRGYLAMRIGMHNVKLQKQMGFKIMSISIIAVAYLVSHKGTIKV